jgi:multiple sugar transport system permease protein
LKTFWYITFPLLIPSAAVALLFQTIFKLRVFDLIFILTNGGPGTQTLPLGILIYRTYFRYLDGGYAAAIAVLLLILGLTISMLYMQILYRKAEF